MIFKLYNFLPRVKIKPLFFVRTCGSIILYDSFGGALNERQSADYGVFNFRQP